MGMISLFRTPRPKQFKYTPIFYDPQKEALKEREKQIRQELGLNNDGSERVSMVRGQFRKQFESKLKNKGSRQTNMRLAIIFIILCVVAYFLLLY
jgi:Flp pilus assembly protein TadB